MEYKYTSIILAKRDVGETDRIYSLYTLEGGKVQVLAKSVRKSQAKLAGSLENFTFADISIAKNQGIGKITSVVVENSFPSLRTEYFSISRISSSFNMLDRLIDLDHRDPAVFELLREYLEAIDSQSLVSSTMKVVDFEEKIDILSLIFQLKLLNFLGYGLELGLCSECGKERKHRDDDEYFFSAKSGGLVCRDCARSGKANSKISGNTVKLISLSYANSLKSLIKIRAEKKEIDSLRMVVGEISAWI